MFYAHTISPIAIAALFTAVLCALIGSFHPVLGLLALAAYVTVGVILPLAVSRLSGDNGLRLRTQAGELSAFVLDSLRGLPEIIQYGQGEKRLEEMDARTSALSVDEGQQLEGDEVVTGLLGIPQNPPYQSKHPHAHKQRRQPQRRTEVQHGKCRVPTENGDKGGAQMAN